MSDEVKVIYLAGKTLTADVFQPDGSERQFNISLTEHAGTNNSLYLGDCATIQAGDIIAADEGTTLVGGGEYKQLVSGSGAGSAVSSAGYVGDFKEDAVLTFSWHTTVAPSTNGTIRVYKENSNDEVTTPKGITDTRDFDSQTGTHRCSINLAANSFYARDANYLVVLSGAIIDGVTVNVVIATFSIEKRYQGVTFTKEG